MSELQDIFRFILIVAVWLFIWFHVPLSGCGRWKVGMGWRIVRAGLILASMLAILWGGI